MAGLTIEQRKAIQKAAAAGKATQKEVKAIVAGKTPQKASNTSINKNFFRVSPGGGESSSQKKRVLQGKSKTEQISAERRRFEQRDQELEAKKQIQDEFHKKRYESAKEDLDKFIKEHPGSEYYNPDDGGAYHERKRLEKAAEKARQAAENANTQAAPALSIDEVRKQYEEASAALEEHKKNNPDLARGATAPYAQTAGSSAVDVGGGSSYNGRPAKVSDAQKELRDRESKVAALKNQLDRMEDQAVTDKDMEEIRQMSPEARKHLKSLVNWDSTATYYGAYSGGEVNGDFLLGKANAQQQAWDALQKMGYSKEKIDQLVSSLSRAANAKNAEAMAQSAEQLADDHAIVGNALSLATSAGAGPAGTLEAVMSAFTRMLGGGDNRYKTDDAYKPGYSAGMFTEGVRGATSENIRENNPGAGGKVMDVMYKGAMGAADNLIRAATAPGGKAIPLGLSATGSFQSSYRDATMCGASSEQALLMGVTDAAIEAFTEKFSLDRLLNDSISVDSVGKMVRSALTQGAVEASEEEVGFVFNLLADSAIMGDKSEMRANINDMVANGASYEEAEKAVFRQTMMQALDTGVTSMFSGAVMDVGRRGSGVIFTDANAPETPAVPTVEQQADTAEVPVADASTPTDIMEAVMSHETTAPAENGRAAISEALASMDNRETLSNNMASRILKNPEAVDFLRGRGVNLDGTASENRAAVKEAIAQMRQEALDQQAHGEYTKGRSQQVQSAIDRLNKGENAPTIDEIMAIPEIAAAEAANSGPETINLPGREKIRQDAYNAAIQKGSWNKETKDYSGPIRQERRMDIVIGLPGSGKSSVYTERLSQEHGSRVIDTDDFREYIPEYNGSNAGIVHREASQIRNSVLKPALKNGDNILLSTIGADSNDLERKIIAYKKAGYSVYLHLNELPNSKSIARAIGRYINEKGETGRFVSPDLIAGYGDGPTQTYLQLTGRGGAKNGELEGNIRAGRGTGNGDAGGTSGGDGGGGESLLAGYDWYNNDVEKGAAPRLIESSERNSSGTVGAARQNFAGTVGGEPTNGVSGEMGADYKTSKTYSNSGVRNKSNPVAEAYQQALENDPETAQYKVTHHADTQAEADARTDTPEKVNAEFEYLNNAATWSAADNITADNIMRMAFESGDPDVGERFANLAAKRKEVMSAMGQAIESQKMTMRDANKTYTATMKAMSDIGKLDENGSTWKQKEGGPSFKEWQKETKQAVFKLGWAVENIEDGDTEQMRDAILQIAKHRHTTAWFGLTSRLSADAAAVLKKLDYDTLKTVANCQLASMADDYRARTKMEVADGLRKQSMLSSIKTVSRNLGGNSAAQVMDSIGDSSSGRIADAIMSKFTGKKTVGNDFAHPIEYLKGAKDAVSFASLCVELDIPIETDADSAWLSVAGENGNGKYIGKTFNPAGSPAMRFMYATQKYMGYALEVSDKIFEGGSKSAVAKSLEGLKNAGLSDTDIEAISEGTANRRTYKDMVWEDGEGKKKGATLSRTAVELKNAVSSKGTAGQILAESVMPFARVPMNVAQTGIDYTAGIPKAIGEMTSIIRDAKNGKTIDPVRQRQAASDFARGTTGLVVISLLTAAAIKGCIKVSNSKDRDEKELEQSQGLSGAQINLDAIGRGLSGGNSEWQSGDILIGLDFLEPFNTLVYLADNLASSESALDLATAPMKSVFNSVMDSPMMTGLSDIVDITKAAGSEDADVGDEITKFAANQAGTFIPQPIRQSAQLIDGYYRDTTGQTPGETAVNQLLASIPWVSKTLPKKVDGLGNPQERPGFFGTFVDPMNIRRYNPDAVAQYIGDLSSRTGDTSIYPSGRPPKNFAYTNEAGERITVPVDGANRETYQQTYGSSVNEMASVMIGNAEFESLSDDLKSTAFRKAEAYAAQMAKASVSDFEMDKAIRGKSNEEIANQIIRSTLISESGFSESKYDEAVAAGYSLDQMKAISEVDRGINGYFSDLTKAWKDGSEEPDIAELDKAYESLTKLPYYHQKFITDRLSGRENAYFTARKGQIPSATFTEMYRSYYDISGKENLSSGEKAKEWSYAVDKAKEKGKLSWQGAELMKEVLKFSSGFTVDDGKYGTMVSEGIPADIASAAYDAIGKVQGTGSISEETGKAAVRDIDKRSAIADLPYTDEQIDAIMRAYMPDYDPSASSPNKTELKYDYIRNDLGYSPKQYVDAYYACLDNDSKRAKIKAIQDALGISYGDASALYKVYGGKKKLP